VGRGALGALGGVVITGGGWLGIPAVPALRPAPGAPRGDGTPGRSPVAPASRRPPLGTVVHDFELGATTEGTSPCRSGDAEWSCSCSSMSAAGSVVSSSASSTRFRAIPTAWYGTPDPHRPAPPRGEPSSVAGALPGGIGGRGAVHIAVDTPVILNASGGPSHRRPFVCQRVQAHGTSLVFSALGVTGESPCSQRP
jgi:hypothetical protein